MCTEKRNLRRLGMVAAIAIIALIFAAQAAADNDPEVRVCAPDWTITAFDAIIKMEYIDGGIKDVRGHFDLSFDTDVVSVVDVTGGKVDGVTIEWEFVEGSDNKKIHVEFTIPDDSKPKTYGEFAKIHFDLVGDTGDSSLLDISDGSLAHTDGTVVSAKWTDDTVNIESFDVTVNAPESVAIDTFDANIDITDIVDLDSAQLELSFDSGVVNVTDVKPGKISGTEVPVDSWGFKTTKDDIVDTIIVIINLPGTKGVSGSGTLATITFDVIGEDGCSSVLDIDEKDSVISNAESDELPVNWIDDNVTINSEAPPQQNDTDTTVFVKNLDDDKLTVFLYIDGNYIDDKDVSPGSTKEYSTYKLVEGPHTFKIKWYDHDTKQEHEKIEERSVSGDSDVVVLYTVEHADEDTKISAHVYVKNNDDDPVDVYLYIDGTYKKYETIEAGDTCNYEEDGYEFDEEELHTFKIRWIDPDTDIEYEKITRQYIETAESVTMYVDSHTEDDLITVSVNAPDYMSNETFEVEIEINDVESLDSGQFCLLFDPNVVNVTDVTDGSMGGKEVTIGDWELVRCHTTQGIGIIRVVFNIAGFDGVSGSGIIATIVFEVTGKDGDCSPLNITKPNTLQITGFENGKLWDGEYEEILADWVNSKVCIGDPSAETRKARVTVFVMNRDDDSLDVELYIDGAYKKSDSVSKDKKEEFSSYSLDEGTHEFKIRWYDPDTDEWYEKHEEHSVSGTTALTLMTDEHGEEGGGINTHVYLKNLDNDRLDVYLYIDEFFKDFEDRIPSGYTREFGRSDGYKLTEGNHTFRIEWYDPDTEKEHQTTRECFITGDAASVTIYIEKHDKISTHVYVMNLDDDDLDVYLYIDEFFKDFEDRVAPGYTREFCESDGYKLTEGTHTFRIEWYDPDTGEEHQTTRECLIERDAAVTLYTEEHGGGDGGISARAYVENLDDTGDSSGSEFAPSTYLLSYWLPSIQSTLFK